MNYLGPALKFVLVSFAATGSIASAMARPAISNRHHGTLHRISETAQVYRELFESLPQIAAILDADATLLHPNRQWRNLLATSPEASAAQAGLHVHVDDRAAANDLFAAIRTCRHAQGAIRVRHVDGMYRRYDARFVPIERDAHAARRWMLTLADREADAAGLSSENTRLLTTAAQPAHLGHWRLELKTDAVHWSNEIFRACALAPRDPLTLEEALAQYHPDDRSTVRACIESTISGGTPFVHESRLLRADGTVRDVVSSGQRECTMDGEAVAIFGVLQDITEAKAAERERDRLILRSSLATQTARVGIWEFDISAGTLHWDAVMHALYGVSEKRFAPTYERWLSLVHHDDRARIRAASNRTLRGGEAFDTEFQIVRPGGSVHVIRAMATVLRDAAGRPERAIGTNWDVTEVRSLAVALKREKDLATFAATHDELTMLLNRRGLEEWIAARPDVAGTLLYLDLDRFKMVNDRGGHAAGDETLRQVARIIKRALREHDASARIGGDEFVAVVRNVTGRNYALGRICSRITAAVEALRPLAADSAFRIGVSIGTGGLTSAEAFDEALREADRDLLEHKSRGNVGLVRAADGNR